MPSPPTRTAPLSRRARENRALREHGVRPPPLEKYTFLFNIGYAGGDGMEHLYSTQIINGMPWRDDAAAAAGHHHRRARVFPRLEHEARSPRGARAVRLHARAVSAEPLGRRGMDAVLRADGDRLASGVRPPEAFYDAAAGIIARISPRRAARRSRRAWHRSTRRSWTAAGRSSRSTANACFSYYTKGAGVALYLDLFIRGHTNNRKSLDDAFRLLRDRTWDAPNASYYLQGRGYTEDDVERAASDAAGDDMHAWFDRYRRRTEDMDYDEVLGAAGMKLDSRCGDHAADGTSSRFPTQRRRRSAFAKDG